MTKSKYDYDIIRDYLHGLVDRETARRMRDLIRTDDVARSIAAGILQLEHEFNGDDHQVESYIEELRQRQLTLIEAETKEEVSSRGWIKLAAAILILAVSSAVLWLTVFRDNVNLVDQELKEPYALAVVDRGSPTESGFKFYAEGDYKRAIISFDSISNDVTATFYNGLSHLYTGEYDDAIVLLGTSTLKASRYRDQASWYRALAKIKVGKKGEAKKSLEGIGKDPKHYKHAEARQLLDIQ